MLTMLIITNFFKSFHIKIYTHLYCEKCFFSEEEEDFCIDRGPLCGSSCPLKRFEQARVKPNRLAYNPRRLDGNQQGQCANSSGNS